MIPQKKNINEENNNKVQKLESKCKGDNWLNRRKKEES